MEINLRFDNPDGTLTREHRVLRLRKDQKVRLTYKGPADPSSPVSSRPEIEFEATSFEQARDFLLALGYVISVSYEKYRTVYLLEGTEIDLDEMPFGNFCEIEGKDEKAIQITANLLDLNWQARIIDSYLAIFTRLKAARNLSFQDLSFKNFENLQIFPADLHVTPAD